VASFGSDSQYQYGQSLYDPYKNLRRPRAALGSLLGTQRYSLFTGDTANKEKSGRGAADFRAIFGTSSNLTSATRFEKAVQNVTDPLSLYSLASQLVVGRRKYQLAKGGYGNTTKDPKTMGGGQYTARALQNVLGLNFDYIKGAYK